MFELKLNPTVTGGTATTMTPAGTSVSGKAVWLFPTHTHLSPKKLEISTITPVTTGKDPGVAQSVSKVTVGTRVAEEGCCEVVQGSVIFDTRIRWALSQPTTVLDEGIAAFRAYVLSPAFESAIKTGILPS